jgi:KaiC/GvpD/RAD55 family RecA-like ATPase
MAKADMESAVSEAIDRHMQGGVIMLELPTQEYYEANAASVVALTRKSFEGIYVSLQQPYKNAYSMLKQKGADAGRVVFIDAVPGQEVSRCVHISGKIEVGELISAINDALPDLRSSKRFIFIDSMAAITSHNQLSETMRLFEFLARAVRKNDTPELLLIFNVTREDSREEFIRDSVIKVDEVVKVG